MSYSRLRGSESTKKFLEDNKETFVVLFFDAEYTGQHEVVQKAVEHLADALELQGKIKIGVVDAEENNDLATQYSIVSVPIVVGISKRGQTKKIDTLEPSRLVSTIREEVRRAELLDNDDNAQSGDPKDKFREYLKKLINKAPVMVFMKGDPKAPRCGFSRQLVELLAKHEVEYETFDILQDDEVRQGLKEYSDWPTYPQIYVKGEFVGGLDILKQMSESGELNATLQV